MKLNLFQQLTRSFYRNLAKGKFYAIFRVLWDSEYRSQINYMLSVCRQHDLILSHGQVALGDIVAGHKINYPKWVNHLVHKINTVGWKKLEPIKVIWDKNQNKWLVVDGNHRLEAFKRTLPKSTRMPVFILQPDIHQKFVQYAERDVSEIEVRDVTRTQAASIVLGLPYKKEKSNV